MLSDLKIHMNLYEYVIKYQLSRLKFPFSASLLIEAMHSVLLLPIYHGPILLL